MTIKNITYMISQTETTGANQYGFYAVPKALEPKKKYREQYEDSQEEQTDDINPFATIEDRHVADERSLDRDYYVDEAPYPEFKPRERGLDYGVQIERTDLFDFDLEVRPLIEILVGRSVVSAINQLQEEKQKDERKSNLDKYQKKRNAELMVTQRMQAKHKRKQQEADRRRLQKDLYVKNKKEATKKLIGRKNAKQCLLGLKNEIFSELEEEGFLRSSPQYDLKIKYEEWLYRQIMQSLNSHHHSEGAAERIIKEGEIEMAEEHQKHIEAEKKRRQEILNERERLRKESEARKEKRRVKKMRKNLALQRQNDCVRFDELMERHQEVQAILKFGDVSNGFSNGFSDRPAVYVSGGLDNFILALLESSGKEFTAEEIQGLLMKVLAEYPGSLEFAFLAKHYDKIEQVRKKMEENKAQFMTDKSNEIKDLIQEVSLDLSLLEATSLNLRSSLHNAFLEAIFAIKLTCQPQPAEENEHELSEADRKRMKFVQRINLVRSEDRLLNRVSGVDNMLRIRFEVIDYLQGESNKEEEEEKPDDDWIDVYDGQYWPRRQKEAKKELIRGDQKAASVALGGFENSWVYDERVLHYLQIQLQKLLQVEGGDKMKVYSQALGSLQTKAEKEMPVYDAQMKWG